MLNRVLLQDRLPALRANRHLANVPQVASTREERSMRAQPRVRAGATAVGVALIAAVTLVPTTVASAQDQSTNAPPAPPPPDVSTFTKNFGPCETEVTTRNITVRTLTEAEIAEARAALRYDSNGIAIELSVDEFLALPEGVKQTLATPSVISSTATRTTCQGFEGLRVKVDDSETIQNGGSWQFNQGYEWVWYPWQNSCSRVNNRISGSHPVLGILDVYVAETDVSWACANANTGAVHDGNGGTPSVQRSMEASFGYFACGWYSPFQRFINQKRRFEIGGYALFALATSPYLCFAPPTFVVLSFTTIDGAPGPWLSWWLLEPVD